MPVEMDVHAAERHRSGEPKRNGERDERNDWRVPWPGAHRKTTAGSDGRTVEGRSVAYHFTDHFEFKVLLIFQQHIIFKQWYERRLVPA